MPLKQDEIKLRGHAIEARIYAEDCDNNFIPSPGKIEFLREPRNRESLSPDSNVRVDTGIVEGDTISSNFDPMISKLIVRGDTRDEAIRRLHWALDDYKIIGLRHNIPFHKAILETHDFIAWDYGTDFIPNNESTLFKSKFYRDTVSNCDLFNFAVIELLLEHDLTAKSLGNPWLAPDNFRLNYTSTTDFKFEDGLKKEHIVQTYYKDGSHFIKVGE